METYLPVPMYSLWTNLFADAIKLLEVAGHLLKKLQGFSPLARPEARMDGSIHQRTVCSGATVWQVVDQLHGSVPILRSVMTFN